MDSGPEPWARGGMGAWRVGRAMAHLLAELRFLDVVKVILWKGHARESRRIRTRIRRTSKLEALVWLVTPGLATAKQSKVHCKRIEWKLPGKHSTLREVLG